MKAQRVPRQFLLLSVLGLTLGYSPIQEQALAREEHGTLVAQVRAPDGTVVRERKVRLKETSFYHLSNDQGMQTWGHGRIDTLWASTDADGRVSIERPLTVDLDSGPKWTQSELLLTMSASIPGLGASYPITALLKNESPVNTRFQLVPTGSITGTVHDAAGRPVEGVRVRASPSKMDFLTAVTLLPRSGFWNFTTTSDKNGAFRFDGLVPGNFDLLVSARSSVQILTELSSGEVRVGAGETTQQDLVLIENQALTGHVSVDSVDELETINLQVVHPRGRRPLDTSAGGQFTFDLRGTFAPPMPHSGPPCLPNITTLWFTNWASDAADSGVQHKLAGSVTLDLSRDLPGELNVRMADTATLLFDVSEGGQLTGYFNVYFAHFGDLRLPAEGEPSWETVGQLRNMPCRTYVPTRDDGAQIIDGVPPGVYELYVWHGGARGQRATLAGETRITVTARDTLLLDPMELSLLPIVRCTVSNTDSFLIGKRLSFEFAPVAKERDNRSHASVLLQNDGTFRARVRQAGQHRGLVRPEFWARDGLDTLRGGSVSDVFEFEAFDEGVAELDVSLRTAPRFRVKVLYFDGALALGHYVRFEAKELDVPLRPITRLAANDSVVEPGMLPLGTYIVSVLAPGSLDVLVSEEVELQSIDGLREVEIRTP